MTVIATLGPIGSDGFQAAKKYKPHGEVILFNRIADILTALGDRRADFALIPVYNTREGEVREYFRILEGLSDGFWMDNVVLPISLSLGAFSDTMQPEDVQVIVGRSTVLRQCEEFISTHMPQATQVSVRDLDAVIADLQDRQQQNHALIETEDILHQSGFSLISRDVAPYNRTRFAVIGVHPGKMTGYDATSIITKPLPDRVGLLVDILNEFTKRGINILDLRSENDIKTQKLQIYLEVEGHQDNPLLTEALDQVEHQVIQVRQSLKVLGSFPRVDMRVKKIKTFGFIGTGAMTTWFADKLGSEGYRTLISGRKTQLRPEEMISQVDVVVICVPISVTAESVKTYGPLLGNGQALILLAGESGNPLKTALESTGEGVEVMLVHNLWGPQAITMKDKNVAVVKTRKSGSLCSEFESFLYKYGSEIYLDTPEKHDILMGVSQKLPTAISVALAMTLTEHHIDFGDIDSHSTLTSLYGILAMARVHCQNPRTYAEIMATGGEGEKIVDSFLVNLRRIVQLAEQRDIEQLSEIISETKKMIPETFLKNKMRQAQAIDAVLSDIGFKGD